MCDHAQQFVVVRQIQQGRIHDDVPARHREGVRGTVLHDVKFEVVPAGHRLQQRRGERGQLRDPVGVIEQKPFTLQFHDLFVAKTLLPFRRNLGDQ